MRRHLKQLVKVIRRIDDYHLLSKSHTNHKVIVNKLIDRELMRRGIFMIV